MVLITFIVIVNSDIYNIYLLLYSNEINYIYLLELMVKMLITFTCYIWMERMGNKITKCSPRSTKRGEENLNFKFWNEQIGVVKGKFFFGQVHQSGMPNV